MKKVLFITDAKGGPGKTLIAYDCRQALDGPHYPPIFGERTPQRFPRPKLKRLSRVKNSPVVFHRR
jgi:hypothetical protein